MTSVWTVRTQDGESGNAMESGRWNKRQDIQWRVSAGTWWWVRNDIGWRLNTRWRLQTQSNSCGTGQGHGVETGELGCHQDTGCRFMAKPVWDNTDTVPRGSWSCRTSPPVTRHRTVSLQRASHTCRPLVTTSHTPHHSDLGHPPWLAESLVRCSQASPRQPMTAPVTTTTQV